MKLKHFTDLIDALGKVNLPKAEVEKMRLTLNETCRLIDTTNNLAIIQMGDILLQAADDEFLCDPARLDNTTNR